MATNLRLRPEAEGAVRAEAERSGRSQQDVLRAAVDAYLRLAVSDDLGDELGMLVAEGSVRRPRVPYRRPGQRISLPPGVTTADLFAREDRL